MEDVVTAEALREALRLTKQGPAFIVEAVAVLMISKARSPCRKSVKFQDVCCAPFHAAAKNQSCPCIPTPFSATMRKKVHTAALLP